MAAVRDRPVAPHLTIWRWGPHMLASIIHRITGAGLSVVGLAVLTWWLTAVAGGPESYATFTKHAMDAEHHASTIRVVPSAGIRGKATAAGVLEHNSES